MYVKNPCVQRFFVPVDHSNPQAEKLPLHIVKLPAIRSNAEVDPVFVLAGGPGQGASEVISTLYPALRKVHQRRTLIFLDQRGTGQSDPLDCELPDDNGTDVPVEALQTCVNELPRSASLYQTNHLAADTNWVRQVLGYSSINLYGVSYGTLGSYHHEGVSDRRSVRCIGWCSSISKVNRW